MAEFIHFIEKKHGIFHAYPPQAFDNTPRHRSDVSAAMTANLRFVPDPAQGRPGKLAADRPRDGGRQRSLSHARRTDEAKNRRAAPRLLIRLFRRGSCQQLMHRQVFQYPLFYFL